MVVMDGRVPDGVRKIATGQTNRVWYVDAPVPYVLKHYDDPARAANKAAATEQFLEFSEKWDIKYPAMIKLWSNAWAEIVPFLSYDAGIRKVICSRNAIESTNARIHKDAWPLPTEIIR